jgi:hypothetical protein
MSNSIEELVKNLIHYAPLKDAGVCVPSEDMGDCTKFLIEQLHRLIRNVIAITTCFSSKSCTKEDKITMVSNLVDSNGRHIFSTPEDRDAFIAKLEEQPWEIIAESINYIINSRDEVTQPLLADIAANSYREKPQAPSPGKVGVVLTAQTGGGLTDALDLITMDCGSRPPAKSLLEYLFYDFYCTFYPSTTIPVAIYGIVTMIPWMFIFGVILSSAQAILSIISTADFVSPLGRLTALTNMFISLLRGNIADALINSIQVLPGIALLGGATKLFVQANRAVEGVIDAVKLQFNLFLSEETREVLKRFGTQIIMDYSNNGFAMLRKVIQEEGAARGIDDSIIRDLVENVESIKPDLSKILGPAIPGALNRIESHVESAPATAADTTEIKEFLGSIDEKLDRIMNGGGEESDDDL